MMQKFLLIVFIITSLFSVCRSSVPKDSLLISVRTDTTQRVYADRQIIVGVGNQSGIYAGIRVRLMGLIVQVNIGYLPLDANRGFKLTEGIGWLFAPQGSSSGLFAIAQFTVNISDLFNSKNEPHSSFITGNIGWNWHLDNGINYSLRSGAGLKIITDGAPSFQRENKFFVNIEGNIGFPF